MAAQVTLQHLRDAHQARDPELVELLTRLMTQETTEQPPTREGVYTFEEFLASQQTPAYRGKSLDEQAQFRMQRLAALESDDAEVPLPDRLRCHDVVMDLWNADDIYSRTGLLRVIAEVSLAYGPFKAFKRIFKEAEARDETEIYGALAARFDMAFANRSHTVSQRTLGYLVRRGWRYLRRIGETFPAIYPDVATDFLIHYQGHDYQLAGTWILNHIFFHEMKVHTRAKFQFTNGRPPQSWRKHRAFDDLWRRSPRPLFTLLERAQADRVIEYATVALKSDFRAALREVEPAWVARLISVGNAAIDSFVVWILGNVPRFEQSKYRDLDLHDAVLQLFHSGSEDAQKYAANYARTHARDLPVATLIVLANQRQIDTRKLAVDLLQSRDPRKEIGLDAWADLLATDNGYGIAEEALRKHFGANELTPEWFAKLLSSAEGQAQQFAQQRLLSLYSREQLGWTYFADLIEQLDANDWRQRNAGGFCCQQLERLDLTEVPQDRLRRLFLHPISRHAVETWIHGGQLKASALGADFLKTIGYQPNYDADPLINELKKTEWGKDSLEFDADRAETALGWLQDVRQFQPGDLGFEWLLELVQRSEPLYHSFAVETMTKVFLPADFAPSDASDQPAEADTDTEINIDLGGATFVFTGKLATMTRGEAQAKVTTAGGANSNSVTKKLDYLIIGDEGSPMYGQGRKGSKQTKGEKLNEEGASIRIISETAFLQMLAGEQREFSEDAIQAGCQRLWSMMCGTEQPDLSEEQARQAQPTHPDAPLARFARTYIRRHHPDICLAETDRPVDPGAEIPAEFLSFERVLPLFSDNRQPLRELALEFAKWEFLRWAPPIDGIVEMCESPYPEVRDFVAMAMTADDAPEHRRYRVDPEVLTADAVYSFCESRNRETRQLGMTLIDLHPRLRVPDELFRLTESPDKDVRAFAIRTFWTLYRDRGTTADWKPTPPPETTGKKKKRQQPIEEQIGSGTPARPENLPADFEQLHALLRRILFEVPPGRPPKGDGAATDEMLRMRRLPARLAKLKLVETLRDLAIEEMEFAEHVLPLLREFRQSRGKTEHAACLVAVTRIEHHHEEL